MRRAKLTANAYAHSYRHSGLRVRAQQHLKTIRSFHLLKHCSCPYYSKCFVGCNLEFKCNKGSQCFQQQGTTSRESPCLCILLTAMMSETIMSKPVVGTTMVVQEQRHERALTNAA